MDKKINPLKLIGYPPRQQAIFDLLVLAGAENFALFGGAARDADYAARKNRTPQINDYDLRVWLSPQDTKNFLEKLQTLSETPITETPSAGTGRIRYCLNWQGADLDISVRPVPEKYKSLKSIPVEAVAIDRALDADIGLCSIAIDPKGQAWATDEYEYDQLNNTLTVYPINDTSRRLAYASRMQGKFPDSKLIWLGGRHIVTSQPMPS